MSICQRCQTQFVCAVADNTGQPCWCMVLPALDVSVLPEGSVNPDATCLCAVCLPVWKTELIAAKSKL
ncbi:cysteine-rich CWC family protein [Undibacterium sp. RuRC25W]|uniref:cysteine-rich CWC family protein n=1 Tax=Undibacterium sp. RuRC25W TaxID=3413047 RepID=UPI003BF442EE